MSATSKHDQLPHPGRGFNRKEFPIEAVPEPLRSWILTISVCTDTDLSYTALSILVVAASLIGTTRRIKLKDGWREPALLWAILIGESGDRKSAVLQLSLSLINNIERQLYHQNEARRRNFEAKISNSRGHNAELMLSREPRQERCMASDVTVESLAPILKDNPRGILLAMDEMSSFFGGFNAYKRAKGRDEAVWNQLFNGGCLQVDRKNGKPKTIRVEPAGVSILGAIQPGVMRRLVQPSHFDIGLIARFLFTMPARRIPRWTEAEIDPDLETAMQAILKRLHGFKFKDKKKIPIDYGLTKKARKIWTTYHDRCAKALENSSGHTASALSRLIGYTARLALVIHCIRVAARDSNLKFESKIDAHSLSSGITLAEWLRDETLRVYEMLNKTTDLEEKRSLTTIIRNHGGTMSPRELMNASRKYRNSAKAARRALNQLVDEGEAKWIQRKNSQGGRPAKAIKLVKEVG